MPVLAPPRAVCGVRQDHELAIPVRKLLEEVDKVLGGRVAVMDAAHHEHRREYLLGIDQRQIGGHIEISAAGNLLAELELRGDDRLGHRHVIARAVSVAGEDRANHGGIALAAIMAAVELDLLLPPADLWRASAFIGE